MQDTRIEGRPYRSHLHPACFSCKKRKSRCRTRDASDTCMMCQAHGSECIFPRPDNYNHARHPRVQHKSPANARKAAQSTPSPSSARSQLGPHSLQQSVPADRSTSSLGPRALGAAASNREIAPRGENGRVGVLPNLIGLVTETGDESSHIISPAVADDNDILESYISATPLSRRRCLVRPNANASSTRPMRPVRFNVVPRRPLGVPVNQTLAESKCEIIEKLMNPFIDEYINL